MKTFCGKQSCFRPFYHAEGKAPAEGQKKSPELEFVRAILVQFCSSEGAFFFSSSARSMRFFSLQGVKLVVQRGELLFELACDVP